VKDNKKHKNPETPHRRDPSYGGILLRRSVLYLTFAAVTSAFIALVILSPWLLKSLIRVRAINWASLSNVGQTYGAASAIISAVALLGISISLILQARQSKVERVRIVREKHIELLRLALEDPAVYGPITGINVNQSESEIKQRLFATMWMNYGRMGYQMGTLTDEAVKDEFLPMAFSWPLMREWWLHYRKLWLTDSVSDRRANRFAKMADEEFHRISVAGAALSSLGESSSSRKYQNGHQRSWRLPTALAVSVVVVGAIRAMRRRETP
jgi:hypothetical protein